MHQEHGEASLSRFDASALYRVVSECCDAKPTAYCLSSIRRLGTQRRTRPISQYDGLRFRARLVVPDALRRIADSPVSVRKRQVDTLNLHHRQLIEATLICLDAIGRTEAHSEVAMKYQSK